MLIYFGIKFNIENMTLEELRKIQLDSKKLFMTYSLELKSRKKTLQSSNINSLQFFGKSFNISNISLNELEEYFFESKELFCRITSEVKKRDKLE